MPSHFRHAEEGRLTQIAMPRLISGGLHTALFIALALEASPLFATDHFNLESGIPTTLEDIQPVERGSVELQAFGRYLRLRGQKNIGETEPRLAWGILEKTQVEISTPLLLGEGAANGNGDVRISVLRKLSDDRTGAWGPGVALEADVTLPTGVARSGFRNRTDAGFSLIMKKDVGPHSFHLNAGFDWTDDHSEEEDLRRIALSIVVGHDTPLTERIVLVSDVAWRQADATGEKQVWLLETGARAQVARSLVGAVGIAAGLNRGQETPLFSVTAGFQLSL